MRQITVVTFLLLCVTSCRFYGLLEVFKLHHNIKLASVQSKNNGKMRRFFFHIKSFFVQLTHLVFRTSVRQKRHGLLRNCVENKTEKQEQKIFLKFQENCSFSLWDGSLLV